MGNTEQAFRWETDGVWEATLRALEELGVNEVEMEVSQMYLEPLLELAEGGEVMPIDTSDPAGGFGGADLWIATLIPALAAAMGLRNAGTVSRSTLDSAIDEVVRRVGSPRAIKDRAALERVIYSAMGIAHPTPSGPLQS